MTLLFFFLACGSLFFAVIILWYFQQKEQNRQQKDLELRFQALSLETMQKSQENFLQLAEQVFLKHQVSQTKELDGKKQEIAHLLDPIKQTLVKLDQQHQEIEKKREGAYASLNQQIRFLIDSEKELRKEANQLSQALRAPNVGGSWGQVHLRRVVELSGLAKQCDFFEQAEKTDGGRIFRPDLLVKLPGDRNIVIDAKVSLGAYLDALNSTDEKEKKDKFLLHTTHIKKHIKELSSKEYWRQFHPSPEYVILFLPAEAFFSSAVQQDPSIVEMGMGRGVILATPTTLIAILKAIALSWRQDHIREDAKQIALLGKELYERLGVMRGHWDRLGRSLTQSVDAYNQAISSLESRVLVSARKLQKFSSSKEIATLDEVEKCIKSASQAHLPS